MSYRFWRVEHMWRHRGKLFLQRYGFAIFVGLLFVAVAVAVHLVKGTGFGLYAEAKGQMSLPSGILFNSDDNLSYASWAQQARLGAWRFRNLYTLEAHREVYFNPYFGLVGWLSRWTGWPVYGVMTLLGLGMAFLALFGLYAIALQVGVPLAGARVAVVLAAFSSGVGALFKWGGSLLGVTIPAGADLGYQDAILFSTFMTLPYHTFAVGILVLVLWYVHRLLWGRSAPEQTKLQEEASGKGASEAWAISPEPLCTRTVIISMVLIMILSWIHPYEPLMLLLVAWSWLGVVAFQPEAKESKRRAFLWIVLWTGAVLPAFLYNLWVSTLPVWSNFAKLSSQLYRPPWYWWLGYGVSFPLAIVGVWVTFREARYMRVRFLALWSAWLLLLLGVLGIPQSKVCNGGHIALCICAGLGWKAMWDWLSIRMATWRWKRSLQWCIVAVMLVLSSTTSVFLVSNVYKASTYGADLAHSMHSLRRLRPHGVLRIACDVRICEWLPGIFGAAVWAGHWSLTPEYKQKVQQLRTIGVGVPWRYAVMRGARYISQRFSRWSAHVPADFLLLHRASAAAAFAARSPIWQHLQTHGRWSIFERRSRPVMR